MSGTRTCDGKLSGADATAGHPRRRAEPNPCARWRKHTRVDSSRASPDRSEPRLWVGFDVIAASLRHGTNGRRVEGPNTSLKRGGADANEGAWVREVTRFRSRFERERLQRKLPLLEEAVQTCSLSAEGRGSEPGVCVCVPVLLSLRGPQFCPSEGQFSAPAELEASEQPRQFGVLVQFRLF